MCIINYDNRIIFECYLTKDSFSAMPDIYILCYRNNKNSIFYKSVLDKTNLIKQLRALDVF